MALSPLAQETAAAADYARERIRAYYERALAPPRKTNNTEDNTGPHGPVAIGLDLGYSVDHSALCAVEALPSDSSDLGDSDNPRIYADRQLKEIEKRNNELGGEERLNGIYYALICLSRLYLVRSRTNPSNNCAAPKSRVTIVAILISSLDLTTTMTVELTPS